MKKRNYTISGVLVTLLATAGLIWACAFLLRTGRPVSKSEENPSHANESTAYRNLLAIADAQERYRESDWDHDGITTYSAFVAHLWQTVDGEGRPVKTRFVPQRLAFATHPALAPDGYYYRMLYRKGGGERPRMIDHQKEWAVMALPAAPRKSGRIMFLCNQTQRVFVRPVAADAMHYPLRPETEGWTAVDGMEDLNSYLAELADRP